MAATGPVHFRTMAALNPSSVAGLDAPKTPEEGLKRITQEFESVFIGELLKEMRKTDFSGSS